MDDYLWNFRGRPDPLVRRLERALVVRRYRFPGGRGSLYWILPLAAAALLLAAVAIRSHSRDGKEPEAVVAVPADTPSCVEARESDPTVAAEAEPATR